ncbi:hypothetical protein Pla144_16410 [Bythopirellula polymerisocia]|uniref:Uncharacterized protein n=2 Tax=Bythopirellula polymerisocia TaxID=2528003 RepID=A0A5C6CTS3_9BACT|nr:hypothetical protein Pla144_16410 [Bythopirellula polymerisocia]
MAVDASPVRGALTAEVIFTDGSLPIRFGTEVDASSVSLGDGETTAVGVTSARTGSLLEVTAPHLRQLDTIRVLQQVQ